MTLDVEYEARLVLAQWLGLVFLVSSATKLRTLTAFIEGALAYSVLPTGVARWYGRTLPFVEGLTGLLLVSGWLSTLSFSLSTLILISFAVAIIHVVLGGRRVPCHCFTGITSSSVGLHTLLRDLILLAPSAWLLTTSLNQEPIGPDDPNIVSPNLNVLAFLLAILLTLTYLLASHLLDLLASTGGYTRDLHRKRGIGG